MCIDKMSSASFISLWHVAYLASQLLILYWSLFVMSVMTALVPRILSLQLIVRIQRYRCSQTAVIGPQWNRLYVENVLTLSVLTKRSHCSMICSIWACALLTDWGYHSFCPVGFGQNHYWPRTDLKDQRYPAPNPLGACRGPTQMHLGQGHSRPACSVLHW